MPENYWSEKGEEADFDPIDSLMEVITDPEEEEDEFRSEFFEGLSGRRRKAATVMTNYKPYCD